MTLKKSRFHLLSPSYVSRGDLLSWRMNFSWIPFSSADLSWNFFIGIKSSLLKDLKYDKRKQADKTL